jgi:hypothetical protein
MCKVESTAIHSFGGGSQSQSPIDNVAGSIICYDVGGKQVYKTQGVTTTDWATNDHTITAGDCHTQKDVQFKTSLDRSSNHYQICKITYNGETTDGSVSDETSTTLVVRASSQCTVYILC